MTPKEVMELIKKEKVEFIDLRFIDFPGIWQHTTIPVQNIDESNFEQGYGFDGSSIRGWQAINESDMLLIPDPKTAVLDPFMKDKTLIMICHIKDPITKEDYSRDPRYIARKALNYLKSTGIGDTYYVGPEAEFFVFDSMKYYYSSNSSFHEIDSEEAVWNTGKSDKEGKNLAYKLRHKEGYFPVPPADTLHDLRCEMVKNMYQLGIPKIEVHHHEVATAGQCEIGMQFGEMIEQADRLMMYKYAVKNTAKKHGKMATFMPKPLFGDNGSGMHVHQSIWKGGKNLFAGNEYAGISETALYFIGGILKHAKALCAITNPTMNSYKRLVPGYEAPVNLAYSARNRSASIRIPIVATSTKAKRIEVRFPDPSCNPYLAFSAMLMAGLDGIQNKIHPGDPVDKNIYDLPAEELAKIESAPGSLRDALNHLREDHEFLLKGDVFTQDVIDTWIEYKTKHEIEPIELRPHPYEYFLYSDI